MTRKEKLQQFAEQSTKGLYLDRHNLIQMVKAGAQWADQFPNWISVEDELPPHRNKSNHKFENDFSVNCFVSDGKDVDTGYYDYRLRKWNCEFLTNVVYWYCPQPPRTEE